MIVVIVLCLVGVNEASSSPAVITTSTDVGVPPVTGFLSFLDIMSAVSAFTFAYQGHSRFLEIAGETKDPKRDFPKALLISYPIMTVLYALTMAWGYGYFGAAIAGFLPDSLRAGGVRQAAGVLLTFHVLVSYVFVSNIFTKNLHFLVPFSSTEDYPQAGSVRAQLHWGLLSIVYLGVVYILANVVPFFSALQEVVGALTGSPIIFFFPPFFYLRASHLKSKPVLKIDKILCILSIVLIFPFLFIFCTAASIKELINEFPGPHPPFSSDTV